MMYESVCRSRKGTGTRTCSRRGGAEGRLGKLGTCLRTVTWKCMDHD